MSLFDAAVDLNPHQIEAALFALQSPLSKGVVLADEVGQGKTIEAGIVLCQFWAERRRRLLVLCPASIRKQWVGQGIRWAAEDCRKLLLTATRWSNRLRSGWRSAPSPRRFLRSAGQLSDMSLDCENYDAFC